MLSFEQAAARIRGGIRSDLVVSSSAFLTTGDIDDSEVWLNTTSPVTWFRDPTTCRWVHLRCASSVHINAALIQQQFTELQAELHELGTAYAQLTNCLSYPSTFPKSGEPIADWLFFLHEQFSDCVDLWQDAPVGRMRLGDFEPGQWAVDSQNDLNRYWPPVESVENETTIGRSSIRDVVLMSRIAASFLAGRVAEWESRTLEQHWLSLENTATAKEKRQKKTPAALTDRTKSIGYATTTLLVKDTITALYFANKNAGPPSNREIARKSGIPSKTVDRRMNELFQVNDHISARKFFELLWDEGRLKDYLKNPVAVLTGIIPAR